jgi:hypothetical protein
MPRVINYDDEESLRTIPVKNIVEAKSIASKYNGEIVCYDYKFTVMFGVLFESVKKAIEVFEIAFH